jgi:hypothetical protein
MLITRVCLLKPQYFVAIRKLTNDTVWNCTKIIDHNNGRFNKLLQDFANITGARNISSERFEQTPRRVISPEGRKNMVRHAACL